MGKKSKCPYYRISAVNAAFISHSAVAKVTEKAAKEVQFFYERTFI